MSAGIIFILILALLLVIFTLQNTMLITLKLFFWEITDVPLVLALILLFITGIIVALVIQYPKIRRLRKKIKELNHQLERKNSIHKSSSDDEQDIEINEDGKDGFFNA